MFTRHTTSHTSVALLRLLLALGVAAGVGACGRELPTAPNSAIAKPTATRTPGGGGGVDPDEEVCVTLQPGVNAWTLCYDYDATLVEWEPNARCASMLPPIGSDPDTFALLLDSDPRIVTSERNGVLEPAETRQQSFAFDDGLGNGQTYAEQPAALALKLADAHQISMGEGVRVAVLDTGIDPNHVVFRRHLVAGWDFVDDDALPLETGNGLDDDGDGNIDEAIGHGTHVAGIVALTAPRAQIMPIRVLDADGRGDMVAVAAGIRWAVAHGARVINMSLGATRSSDAVQNAMEEAENAGVTVITSAGNWGALTPEEFPARSSHAHAVAACDAARTPAPFTSYANYVALSAPGVGIRSAFPGNQWRLWSGTSMSAPFVSGAAALLLSVHEHWGVDEVMDRLTATAVYLHVSLPEQQGRLGDGMLSVGRALKPDAPLPAAEPGAAPGDPILRDPTR